MRVGFIGTGAITSALVTGWKTSEAEKLPILLSPRNPDIARQLAERFDGVAIAESNQAVLDESDLVFLAVRPQIAEEVVSRLRFREDHCVVSLIAATRLKALNSMVAPCRRVVRAVALPSAAFKQGPSAICPPDEEVSTLFGHIGETIEVGSEEEFDALCSVTAIAASEFAFAAAVADWLEEHGIEKNGARRYVSGILAGLVRAAEDHPSVLFSELAGQHMTAGGLNEQFLRHMADVGLQESVGSGLDGILARITGSG